MADPFNVVLVFPLLKYQMEYPIKEIITRLQTVLESVAYNEKARKKASYFKPDISRLALNAGKQVSLEKVDIPMEDAVGKVCAQVIVPYPPGIPLLFPGEIISEEAIEQIRLLRASGAKFQGDEALKYGKLTIYVT